MNNQIKPNDNPYTRQALSINKEGIQGNKKSTEPTPVNVVGKIAFIQKDRNVNFEAFNTRQKSFFESGFKFLKNQIEEKRNKLSFTLYFCSFLSGSINERRKKLMNEIKSLEQKLCTEIKTLYKDSICIERQMQKEGKEGIDPVIATVCKATRTSLTNFWNNGIKEKLINKPQETSSSSGKRWE